MRMLTLIPSTLIAGACLAVIGIAFSPNHPHDYRDQQRATDGRCQATTRRGTRCRHPARPGKTTCSQHS